MYLCYIDDSGTSAIPGNTTHFVLAGIAIPIWKWRDADREITRILDQYGLSQAELHTAWMLRTYLEQSRIPGFSSMSRTDRHSAVTQYRTRELLRLQRQDPKAYRQAKKNFRHTSDYIHLTRLERKQLVTQVAQTVSGWGFARMFAECIDKTHFDPSRTSSSIDEQAFEQVVSRFEQFLAKVSGADAQRPYYGLLVHDNNETVAKKHTDLMRRFHTAGTLWTSIDRIIETPLFVNSQLTRMVQIADLCSYALRRYLENGEIDLFEPLFLRADRIQNTVVGVRHFTALNCTCSICTAHRSA